MLSNIVAILVATVLAAAIGGAGSFFMIEQISQTLEEKKQKEEDQKKPAHANDVLVQLPDILTNLASPKNAWVRLKAQVVTGAETSEAIMAEQYAEDIVAYLRTVDLSSLEGSAGFQALRASLKDRVRIRSRGEVKDIVIQEFVVE